MPSNIVRNSTAATASSAPSTRQATGTFTGTVWMDQISSTKPAENATPESDPSRILLNHVTFTPGSRTYWHTHERGQILEVKVGSGWICDRGSQPRKIQVGDIIVCEAGTEHWHGASEGSMMMHLACSLGITSWKEEGRDLNVPNEVAATVDRLSGYTYDEIVTVHTLAPAPLLISLFGSASNMYMK